MMAIATITTNRLKLRQWLETDLAPFAKLNGNPEVMEFFPEPLTLEQSNALALRCKTLIESRGWGFWVVERREDQRFMGFVGLHIPSAPLPFKPCVEVGWRLDRPYWGYGYATEAAIAALQFGFETLNLDEIVSFTSVLNVRSQAVMERLKMHRDPQTFMHPSVPKGHPLEEHCLYRLPRHQWNSESA